MHPLDGGEGSSWETCSVCVRSAELRMSALLQERDRNKLSNSGADSSLQFHFLVPRSAVTLLIIPNEPGLLSMINALPSIWKPHVQLRFLIYVYFMM